MSTPSLDGLVESLSATELLLFRELLRALRTIRYGTVVLTVHDGRLAEIHKTEKIRINELKPGGQ